MNEETSSSTRTHSISTTTNAEDDPSSTSSKHPGRAICAKCDRPERTCLCAAIPATPIRLKRTHCLILQHPYELKRKNRSLPLVELCLDKDHVTVEVSRRLHSEVSPLFMERLRNPHSHVWLIFPSDEAISLEEAIRQLDTPNGSNKRIKDDSTVEKDAGVVESDPKTGSSSSSTAVATENSNNNQQEAEHSTPSPLVTLVFLDGTWQFAKEMDLYNTQREKYPAHLQRVQLSPRDLRSMERPKRFAIRTPPSEQHLSTAEALAWVVAKVEGDESIYQTLMKPLDLMVELHQSFIEENKHRPKRQKVKGPKPQKKAGQSTNKHVKDDAKE